MTYFVLVGNIHLNNPLTCQNAVYLWFFSFLLLSIFLKYIEAWWLLRWSEAESEHQKSAYKNTQYRYGHRGWHHLHDFHSVEYANEISNESLQAKIWLKQQNFSTRTSSCWRRMWTTSSKYEHKWTRLVDTFSLRIMFSLVSPSNQLYKKTTKFQILKYSYLNQK